MVRKPVILFLNILLTFFYYHSNPLDVWLLYLPWSLLLIGQSKTGKTTSTAIHRMFLPKNCPLHQYLVEDTSSMTMTGERSMMQLQTELSWISWKEMILLNICCALILTYTPVFLSTVYLHL